MWQSLRASGFHDNTAANTKNLILYQAGVRLRSAAATFSLLCSTSAIFSLITGIAPNFTLYPALRSSPLFILPFPFGVRLDRTAITLSDGMRGLARLLTRLAVLSTS